MKAGVIVAQSAPTATAAEARAHFSKIADHVNASGRPVTVLKNSRPWVVIAPIEEDSPVVGMDWAALDVKRIDPDCGHALLPQDWDEPDDEGLYDDLV